jgi:FkbM family methyltransferase
MKAALLDLAYHSLAYRGWVALRSWARRTFRCPGMRHIVVDGVTLDVTPLSVQMREYIAYGKYEAAECDLCRRYLTPTDRVLELGGGIGFMGLFCQRQLGLTDYFTVEANPHTLKLLESNYALNGLTPKTLNAAVARENGAVQFEAGEEFWKDALQSKAQRPGSSQSRKTITAEGMTLETIFSQTPFAPTALVVDVEGAEAEFAWEHLPATVEKIVIELHPKIVGITSFHRTVAAIQNRGFQVAAVIRDVFCFLKTPVA